MPAKHLIDKQARLIVTTWEGKACDFEFIEALKKYQDEIQNHPDYVTYNEVLDFSKVTDIKLTTQGIIKIAQIASATDHSEINRKLALIVSSTLAFGLARMYMAYRSFSKNAHKEINIFKNKDDALEWIQK